MTTFHPRIQGMIDKLDLYRRNDLKDVQLAIDTFKDRMGHLPPVPERTPMTASEPIDGEAPAIVCCGWNFDDGLDALLALTKGRIDACRVFIVGDDADATAPLRPYTYGWYEQSGDDAVEVEVTAMGVCFFEAFTRVNYAVEVIR